MAKTNNPPGIKISPSDLTYLYASCKRCFYLKYKHNLSQPKIPVGINNTLDSLFKKRLIKKSINEFIKIPSPQGSIIETGKTIKSASISRSGKLDCYLEGKYDALIQFDDGTYGIVDFKVSKYSPDKIETFKWQLQAYHYAFTHPYHGAVYPISKMGLLFIYPADFQPSDNGNYHLPVDMHWVDVQYNEQEFLKFIYKVQDLLSDDKVPARFEKCPYCKFVSETMNL